MPSSLEVPTLSIGARTIQKMRARLGGTFVMDRTTDRREFVKSLAGMSAASLIGSSVFAQALSNTQTERRRTERATGAAGRIPARGEFVVRNGYVLTMDETIGDVPDGDVHVKNGAIVAVGKNLKAPGATALDARRMIVMPGFVDTHWHMWTTYLRCMAGDKTEDGYFPVTTLYGQLMQPEDMYHSTRLAVAEAIYSGTTTVNDECHNVRSYEHADQDICALREVGIRAQWSYGPYRGMPVGQLRDLASFEKLNTEWARLSNDGLITLAYTWGGIPSGNGGSPPSAESITNAKKEIETARGLGARITMHLASRENTPSGQVQAQADYLKNDMLLVHMLATSPEEMKLVASSGASISVSPGSELRIGYGLTKACDLMDAGINVAVSADTAPLTGNCHMPGILKLLRNVECAKAQNEFKLSARRTLEMGTIQGAKALGIEDKVGSLRPGKRADLIMINTDVITMGVFTDPTHMVVEATEPSNVDTVVIDGRILKRNGKFTAMVPEQIISDAVAARERVRKRIHT
jgi:cytosine/adenosine deaminase-related metal-dependent hydrolase